MLWRASEITGYGIEGKDGHIGSFHDVLLSDNDWTLRWVIVDTGKWLPGRKVPIPILSLGAPNAARRDISCELSRHQVTTCPDVDPAAAGAEAQLFEHYGWAPYWQPEDSVGTSHRSTADRLRSVAHVIGLHIHATDDTIGHVDDFLVSDDAWGLRYMVVDTKNWWPGRKVLVSPRWIDGIDWQAREVRVRLPREQIRNGPEYDPSIAAVVDPDFEPGSPASGLDDSPAKA